MDFQAIIGIVVILVVLPLAVVLLNDWLFNRKYSKESASDYSKRFQARLLKPDFAALEAHFGCPMPPELKNLYANQKEITRGGFTVITHPDVEPEEWNVAHYQPADIETVKNAWEGIEDKFAFADDGCGDGYLIDPQT